MHVLLQVLTTVADSQTQLDIEGLQVEHEMVIENKLMGKFDLVGIPPAPRGLNPG